MEINYFEMVYEDIPIVSEMEKRIFSQPWKEESIAHYMESDTMIFLVARDYNFNKNFSEDSSAINNKDNVNGNDYMIAGYMALLTVADEADLVSIAVHEDYRGMGIARELMDIGYELAFEKGVRNIHLEVRESNIPAISLYESEGFKRNGVRRKFYKNPEEDAYIYTRVLSGCD